MGFVRSIAVVVAAISFVTFTALFGRLPALRSHTSVALRYRPKLIIGLRNTPVGFLHRLMFRDVPKLLAFLDVRVTGGRSAVTIVRLHDYLLNDNHPLVLVRSTFLAHV